MPSTFNKILSFMKRIIILIILFLTTSSFTISDVQALSDSKQIVLDAWALVNEGYYDPDRFDEIQWKKIRQKTLQKQIDTSEQAYSAIEEA